MTKSTEEQKTKAEARKAKRKEKDRQRRAADKATSAMAAVQAPVIGVPIQSVGIGQRFELDSDIFVIKAIEPDHFTVAKLEWAPAGDCMIERWQRPVLPDTVVVPREA